TPRRRRRSASQLRELVEFARGQGYAAAETVNRSKTSPDSDGLSRDLHTRALHAPWVLHRPRLGRSTWRYGVTTVLCTCRVADFDAFRPGYDKALEMFADQIRSWRLWRGQDDPNVIVIEETF